MDIGARGGRRGEDGVAWRAAAGSVALHAAVVALLLLAEGAFGHAPRREPRMRVYAVNIVSPPPTVRGEPPAEAPAPNVGGATPPAPQPAAAPPPPPAAAPTPPPPAPTPPKEPAAAPGPRTPAQTPPRPAPAPPPATRPPAPPTRPAAPPRQPGTSPGPGSGANSEGTGTRGAPTGRNPDANSPGGEGLNVSQRGAECPSPGYCENIVRQVRRYFRRPEGSNGTAEACFTILRDGTVDDIEVRRARGGFAFRMAVQEAVEQAGLRKAFGGLPAAFGAPELPVCVDISPEL